MIFTPINTGSAPNDGTGDTPRAAAQKINSGFEEVEARLHDQGEQIAYAKRSIDDVVALAQESAEAASADRQQTGEDRDAVEAAAIAVAADRVQTGLDRTATHADAVATAADRAVAAAAATTATDKATLATTKATEASSHKDAAYGYAQSAASAVAYQNLAAISTSKVATAIDLFVYDTSRDSDGGAWRKRCQHTSWFNEALNTATRGARREFPAVALLMIEQFRLTIFDADDPALPMWMTFDPVSTTAPQIWRTGRSAKAVAAVNGVIALGLGTGGLDSSSGLIEINLIADRMTRTTNDVFLGYERVAGRNSGTLLTAINTTRFLASTSVNDVAMTVLPDAPIDPATGLPIPTVAVATIAGLSVLKSDGMVFDSSYSGAIATCGFTSDRALWAQFGGYNTITPRGTWEASDNWEMFGSSNYFDNTFNYPLAPSDVPKGVAFGTDIEAVGSTLAALQVVKRNPSALRSKSMAARIASGFNTGWQVGDIRGAWLASKDAANLVSANAWTAGLVDSGWTTDGCAVAASGGNLDFTFSAANKYAYKAFNTVVGQSYVIEASMTGIARNVSVSTSGVNGNPLFVAAAGNTFVRTFVATQTTHYFGVAAASGAGTTTLSSLSIRVASADRSIKGNGLKVNGTIARAAVASGAELVGFSGFSASNYLEQPYNSDLDFGTGDFSVIGWLNSTASGAEALISRGYSTGGAFSGQRWEIVVTGADFRAFFEGFSTLIANVDASLGAWVSFAVLRRGNAAEIWLDGRLAASADITGFNATNTSALLTVGRRHPDFATPAAAANSALALLRVSATAPSADQIRKIYEDERALFQPSAACTLYGASDAVTALAFDRDTGLLHVGTSAGRSVFQGLRRVANTTNAVETAIAAANGLVVDE